MSVVKTRMFWRGKSDSSPHEVLEHWTGDTREELVQEYYKETEPPKPDRFGPALIGPWADPSGLIWHADFSYRVV
jgi:hypothetical protein